MAHGRQQVDLYRAAERVQRQVVIRGAERFLDLIPSASSIVVSANEVGNDQARK